MADVLFLLLAAAFFALCGLYVRALDRLVGPPDTPDPDREGAAELVEARS